MPLRVRTMVIYPIDPRERWPKDRFPAMRLVKNIKRETMGGSGDHVPVRGQPYWLAPNDFNGACQAFARWAAPFVPEGASLVPLPSSKSVHPSDQSFAAFGMASALAELTGAEVEDIIRFRRSMLSAHRESGTRDPHLLYEGLTVLRDPIDEPVILIDDVVTSGGHLRAAAALLLSECDVVVADALCAGWARDEPADSCLDPVEQMLPDFSPIPFPR